MHCVRMDCPDDWPICNVYTLSDLHIGDPHANMTLIYKRIEEIVNDPYGVVVLNGDLMNSATRGGVSDVYGEKLSPMQQIDELCTLLRPIAGKIAGATAGNHEQRAYRDDGIDITRLVCRELGVEERYSPDGLIVFLRFGKKEGHGRHKNRDSKQWYTLYVTHGSGGGRKEGAKAIRLADMASICDCDCYIHGHTHLPMIMKQRYYRTSPGNSSVQCIERLFVNTGATLEYGGYGQTKEFKPASMASPIITLEAARKRATARM